jgi:hypothetical protein
MRRFLISNAEKFTGTAEVTYNNRETLCKIDCTGTDMGEMVIAHFKSAVPATIAGLMHGKSFAPGTTVVEDGYVVTFEMFYKDYPLKRNRYKVEKAWNKLNNSEQVIAFNSLHFYKIYLTRANWQTPMIGDRYLKDREFETDWNKLGHK